MPGVKVAVLEKATGARSETVSNDAGDYQLPYLTPGIYELAAEVQGFKRYVRPNITVSTNQRYQIDVTLEVGQVSDSVTVTEDAPLLQASSASVGQVINSAQVENMPMNGRTPLVLAQLAFGVTPTTDPRFTRPFDNGGPAGFSMGGAPGGQNELLLDGQPDMTRNRRVAYNPPVDAVSEVKVEAFQPDAAFGNTGGGTVNVVMKGGTNDFHGTLYEFNQVSRLAATPFFTNAAGLRKPVTRFNQYGVTAGGPVWIPKLFNGRNRVFWFYGFEGIRNSSPEPITDTVPTEAQRRGDFSSLLGLGSQFQIYDPLTGVREGARVRRQPMPGNIIPANRLNAIARNYLQFWPTPNQPGQATGQDNFLANTVRSDTFESHLGRLDVNVSEKHKFFFNMRWNNRIENRGNRYNNIASGNFLGRENWGATVDDVYTFNSTTILNTRAGWTRFNEGNTRPSLGFNFGTLGFPQTLTAASPQRVLPTVDLDRYGDIGTSGGSITPFDTFQLFSTLTKIKGRHNLKFGVDLRQQRESNIGYGNSSGSYTFRSGWTQGPLDNSPASPFGQDLAGFLLGLPTGGSFDLNAFRTQHAYYNAFFVQDDWRVSSTLTLNLGMRYERETGTVERFDRTTVGFDTTAVNSTTAAARAAYARNPSPLLPAAQFNPTGGVLFAGPNRRNVYSTDNHLLGPRFGFAWSPSKLKNTVIRGGTGIYYFTYGTTGIQQPGFSQSTPYVATLDAFLTPANTLSNPFPNGLIPPVGNANGVNTFLGQGITFTNPVVGQPYSWRWNFNVQRQFGGNLVVEAGYIGNQAVHLSENRDLNFIPRELLSTSPVRDQANIDRLTAAVPNPFAGLIPGTGLNGGTIGVEQLLRPFPQFSGQGGVRIDGLNTGSSFFHMFQMRVEKRFSSGLQFLANYGWQKLIEKRSRLNVADPFLEKRIADEDRPQRFVFSTSYALPIGKGKTLLGNSGPWMNRLVGGFVLNAIYTTQSGDPVEWGNVIYLGGPLNWQAGNVNQTFDTTRFNRRPQDALDRNLRTFNTRFTTYRNDIVNNIDLSMLKNIAVTEKIALQFRFEAFNAFNRAQFNPPNLNPVDNNFARITSQSNLPRQIQMALRLKW